MKKLLSLLLVLAMLLSLSACVFQADPENGESHKPVISTYPRPEPTGTTGPGETQPAPTTPAPTSPAPTDPAPTDPAPTEPTDLLDPNGTYDTKDLVALFIHQYGKLPNNYMTKTEARSYGWSGGALNRVVPGKCIGGDTFYNRENQLPHKPGRTWTECDIDTLHASQRGAKRIVFSNDGLIYYTHDHYKTFTLLYGTP